MPADRAVIDRVLNARLAQIVVLGQRGSSEDLHALDGAAKLDRRQSHSTGGHMNQHLVEGTEVTNLEEHVIGRQVIRRQRRRLVEAHLLGDFDHLPGVDSSPIGVAAKSRHREHPVASSNVTDIRSDCRHPPRNLVAHHHRRLRSIRVQPDPPHDVREVQSSAFNFNHHLACTGQWIRRFADL